VVAQSLDIRNATRVLFIDASELYIELVDIGRGEIEARRDGLVRAGRRKRDLDESWFKMR
jgi:hypothetical protein